MKASNELKKYLKMVLERRGSRLTWFYICTELLTALYDNKEKQYKCIIKEFKQFFIYRKNYASNYSSRSNDNENPWWSYLDLQSEQFIINEKIRFINDILEDKFV